MWDGCPDGGAAELQEPQEASSVRHDNHLDHASSAASADHQDYDAPHKPNGKRSRTQKLTEPSEPPEPSEPRLWAQRKWFQEENVKLETGPVWFPIKRSGSCPARNSGRLSSWSKHEETSGIRF